MIRRAREAQEQEAVTIAEQQLITHDDVQDLEKDIMYLRDEIKDSLVFDVNVPCDIDTMTQEYIIRPTSKSLSGYCMWLGTMADLHDAKDDPMFQGAWAFVQQYSTVSNKLSKDIDLLITKVDELKLMVRVLENIKGVSMAPKH